MKRHHIALLQQRIKRHVLDRGRATTVIGQNAAAESLQPVHHCRANASRSDDSDGHVAELTSAHVIQPIVMDLGIG